ncbi:hypothetical protein ACSSWA_01375 [Melioribacter sp. Ez-97]|uniref:hypothetical protein n=1 Tax=Melioribacter sp. Ez-97 TaxID=3423434 RepID=UPI003ED85621
MKNYNWMPILKTGTFVAKNGKKVTFEEKDLDKIIENTDLGKEPQFVVEHPSYDKLGFGTIAALKRVGKYLFALPKTVNEKFKEAVNRGELPGRSVSLDEKTLSLSHIGFLPPEVAPAVDGLGTYSFSSGESNLSFALPGVESHFAEIDEHKYEFAGGGKHEFSMEISRWPFSQIKNLFRNIKNAFIEKFGREEADQILPEYDLEVIGDPPVIIENKDFDETKLSSNNKGDDMKVDLSKYDFSKVDPELKAALESLQKENKELEVQLQQATQTISAAQLEKNRNEVLAFCESPEMKLKILPAEKEKVVSLLLAVKEKGNLEFSSSDGAAQTKVQFSAYDYLKDLLKRLPDKIEMSEVATKQNAGDNKLADYQILGKEIASFVNPKKN